MRYACTTLVLLLCMSLGSDRAAGATRLPECPTVASLPQGDWSRVDLGVRFSFLIPPCYQLSEGPPQHVRGGKRWSCGTDIVEAGWGMWSNGSGSRQCTVAIGGISVVIDRAQDDGGTRVTAYYQTRHRHGEPLISAWSSDPRALAVLDAIVRSGGFTPRGEEISLSQPQFQDPFTRPQIDWKPRLVLDVGQAERILGNKGRLEKVTAYLDEGTRVYQASFRDDQLDPSTGKIGVLGYKYEEYQSAEAARSYLDSTLRANRLDPRDAIRMEGGAELHYFTGGNVIRMFMMLRDNRLVLIKVNPVTSHYSLVELRKVAAELAKEL